MGFASVNISDTRAARTLATNSMIEEDQREVERAEGIAAQECRKVGPICQQRRNDLAHAAHSTTRRWSYAVRSKSREPG